ncbi:MAG TPA: alpha/beta hydrolase [Rhodopila sp.]|uniref:alpha/beta hydrolase n=1 Tax=Rhodopila sp. TaxID=2480087 RepID=UPI002C04E233|nr:alpha/beta hydrolase [Rhodopila sp.]HVY16081.1 alpha/beta hydrolase [Rhodopila sp.]
MAAPSYDHTVADFKYLEHKNGPLRLRLFAPIMNEPAPVIVDVHGGAWCNGDLADCEGRDLTLVRAGFAVAAINFRHADAGYPTSLQDINYAVRWLKSQSARLCLDAGRVGLCGQSSGGHLAMLAAMRPRDTRYAAIPLPDGAGKGVDASVQAVVMVWPVINPLSRYLHALRHRAMSPTPAWVGDIPERHDTYWKTKDAMAEGNPMLILERGEPAVLPPALWIQGTPDPTHDYRDPESPFDGNEPMRFAHDYRKAGGTIEVTYIDNATRGGPASHEPAAAFFLRHFG